MTDYTANIPEVVEQVRVLFERYEQALIDKDVEVLDGPFWNSPHTIRLANAEHTATVSIASMTFGSPVRRVPAPRRSACGSTSTPWAGTSRPSRWSKGAQSEMTGRQTQNWVRFPDVGWKVIHARMSP